MKKLTMCFLIGFLMIATTVCGNTTTGKDITAKFKNSVFIGDSTIKGFANNEILPQEGVLTEAGATAGFTYEKLDSLLAGKNPDNVFIMLGTNDMLMPVNDPKKLFENDVTRLINKIKKGHPNSKIYLQSITPVTKEALKNYPQYKRIDEYNGLLKELAGKLSVNYVDIGTLVKKNPNLFTENGVLFKKEFLPLLLNKLAESL